MRGIGFQADPEQQSIIYNVPCPTISPSVLWRMEGDNFRLKDEFHITVLGGAASKLAADKFENVVDVIDSSGLPMFTYHDDLYKINRPKIDGAIVHDREALVARVASSQILGLLARVAKHYDVEPEPLLHVTIATKPDTEIARRGIGIANAVEWHTVPRKLYATNWQDD